MPAAYTLPDWLGTLLFGVRDVQSSGAPVNDSSTLNFVGPLVATFNTQTGSIDITETGSYSGAVLAPTYGLGSATPPSWSITTAAPVTTTDATLTNLGAAIPLGAGQSTALEIRATANLIGDGTNPACVSAFFRIKAAFRRTGSAAPVMNPSSGDDGSLLQNPFTVASPLGTIAAGQLGVAIAGNAAQIQVMGRPYSAFGAWQALHSYTAGMLITNGGMLYFCIASGTSAPIAGPSGTAADIPDNGAQWCYVEADSKFTIEWTLNAVEILPG